MSTMTVGTGAPAAELPRLLPPPGCAGSGLTAHLRAFGALPYRGAAQLLTATVRAAGLTGRGGAAFPAWRKLAAVATAGRGPAVVAGNGAEGEPASRKDRTLLWNSPHLVLDGLQLAAEAVAADRCYLYVHPHPQLERRLMSALTERAGAGSDRVPVQLISAPPRFLAGEASAAVARLSGGMAVPQFKIVRPSERGVHGAPTLVQNVETLAQIALIGRYGAAWFRSVGTEAEPGSMLVTCQQPDGTVQVMEAAIGTPLAELLRWDAEPAAVLTGGYHGAWIPGAQARALRLANADLRPQGAMVGAGVLAALPADRCGLAETARVARYLALESAGQCGPCLNGLPRIATALTDLAAMRPGAAVQDLRRWLGLVPGRGACHHPDG
jgi:NADH:ubiquinone oxidoreductase subunit F (NADH-binding)